MFHSDFSAVIDREQWYIIRIIFATHNFFTLYIRSHISLFCMLHVCDFLFRLDTNVELFSQSAWAQTRTVGCGSVTFQTANNNNLFTTHIFCNYGPGILISFLFFDIQSIYFCHSIIDCLAIGHLFHHILKIKIT